MSEVAPGLVTVFGGSGFVGSQVVQALARQGWRIRVAVRRPDLAFKVHTAGHVGQIYTMRCDATDPVQVEEALRGCDAAVNLIGILYEAGKNTFEAVHVDAARNIAEACAAGGVQRLIHMSALGVSPDSDSAYARSKAAAELAVREVKPNAVIVRPSVVFGPGDDFLNRFASMAGWSPVLPLIGGGQTRLQPVFVGDVAAAVATLLSRTETDGRTFELGGPAVMTFEDVLGLVVRETHRQRPLLNLPFYAARILGSVAQLAALVGLKPLLTRDQVLLLQTDNVVSKQAEGLAELDIEPTGVEALAASYLWRYRRGGQFAEAAA